MEKNNYTVNQLLEACFSYASSECSCAEIDIRNWQQRVPTIDIKVYDDTESGRILQGSVMLRGKEVHCFQGCKGSNFISSIRGRLSRLEAGQAVGLTGFESGVLSDLILIKEKLNIK